MCGCSPQKQRAGQPAPTKRHPALLNSLCRHCTSGVLKAPSRAYAGCLARSSDTPYLCRTRGQLVVFAANVSPCLLTSTRAFCICKENLKPPRRLNAKSPLASVGFRAPNTNIVELCDSTSGQNASNQPQLKDGAGGWGRKIDEPELPALQSD